MASLHTAGGIAARTAGLFLAAGLVVGCQQRQPARPAAPAGPPPIQAAMQMRRALMQADPSARIGVVAAAVPSAQLVAVNDVPAGDFREGQAVQFLDGRGNPVAVGYVRAVKGDVLHVMYDTSEGGRAPSVGDLAMRVDSGVDLSNTAGSQQRPADDAGAVEDPGAVDDAGAMEAAGTATDVQPEQQPADDAQAEPAPRPRQGRAQAGGASRLPPRRSATAAPAASDAAPTDAAPTDATATDAAQPEPQPEAQPATEAKEADRPSVKEEAETPEFKPAEGSDDKAGLPPVEGTEPPTEKPETEQPATEEQPAAEQAAEKPAAEEPAAEEKPAAEEQPAAEEKPADEKAAGEKAAGEAPADEKPADEKPAEEPAAEEKPDLNK
jgi:hypothetical protein